MKDIRINQRRDIRTVKTYCTSLAISAFILLASSSMVFAQEGRLIEVADAMNKNEINKEMVTQYRGMPELAEPLPGLNYPEKAQSMGVEGRVVVRFTVNKQGKATDVKVLHGLGYGCDEEAARVIRDAVFKPIVNTKGYVVSRTFTTPLTFRLNN